MRDSAASGAIQDGSVAESTAASWAHAPIAAGRTSSAAVAATQAG